MEELTFYMKKYEPPKPIVNSRLEERINISIDGRDILLDVTIYNHFRIQLLGDLLKNLKASLDFKRNFYIMPRKCLINEFHLPVIYRVKHFINQNNNEKSKLDEYLQLVFKGKVNIDFINDVLNELVRLEIVEMNISKINKGKYFDFFY